MKPTTSALALAMTAAPLGTLAATFNEPPSGYGTIAYGESFTLRWTGDGSPATIGVVAGPSTDVKEVASLTSGDSSSSFTTSLSKGGPLAPGKYSFSIKTEKSAINYSSSFCVETCAAEGSKVSSSAASTATQESKEKEEGYYGASSSSSASVKATGTGASAYMPSGTGGSKGSGSITPFTGGAGKVVAGVAGAVCVVAGVVGGMMVL